MSEPPKPRPSGRCGDLSPVSLQWLEQADPVSRKARGQYLTPRPVAEALIDRVGLQPGLRVLDPGVGTGELLRAL
ncbi:MAG TPA: N-6 DNA methylase, partial [Solirubrobacterales bacterium]|nr:N-6 DNA methylase [Solirubrobacterales bacterium]